MALCGAILGASLFIAGCADAESTFTSGRIETLCNDSIPVCSVMAGCTLGTDQYLKGEFPGGQHTIVRTDVDEARLVARFLLSDQVFPGTEFLVRAYDTGCADFDEGLTNDRNLFELAGADGILEYHVDVVGRGDHLVEFFSDMAAGFLFAVDIEE